MNAELHEPGRACCGQRGTGAATGISTLLTFHGWAGGWGSAPFSRQGTCRFVASQVACGSDRNGDGTARGSGPGEDAVPRRPWGAAAAVERAQRPCVVLGKTRPTGGQEANRWKWRRRSDSEGWLERPATHAPPKTSAARRKGPEMCIVCFRNVLKFYFEEHKYAIRYKSTWSSFEEAQVCIQYKEYLVQFSVCFVS